MRSLAIIFVGLLSATTVGAVADGTAFVFPQVAGYGGIVRTPQAAEPPQSGAKVIFDIIRKDTVSRGTRSVMAQSKHRLFAWSDVARDLKVPAPTVD